MVIAGLINPLLKQFEMFTKNAYDRPKHKEMLTRFGPVSSCGQEMVELPGGVLPYMGYIGMCRCEGYGFQAVYSRIGYVNQSVWV